LEECSSIIGQIQIDNIYTTLALIENRYKTDKINFYIKTNIQNEYKKNINITFLKLV